VSINRLLVQLLDFELSLIIDGLENVLAVIFSRVVLNFLEDLGILWQNTINESFCKAETLDFFVVGNVDKLTLALVNDVVVANEVRARKLFADKVKLVAHTILNQTETDTDLTFIEEIHFWHLVFFIIDHFFIFRWLKLSWHESKRDII
jgi:hypothetical protein